MKILAWNIQQGGGSRVSLIMKNLLAIKAEIVCLNEFKNNNQGLIIRNALLKAGYHHQIVGANLKSENTVMIASKIPFDGSHVGITEPDFPHNIVKAAFPAFSVYSMYLPHKKKHGLFDVILSEMEQGTGIFVGDFNSGRNYIDQKGNSFWYSEYFDHFEDLHYRDAWRHIHKDKKDYSWFSHQGNGYRYDHTIVHESILPVVKDCYYIQEWRISKASDHAAMILELG